MSQLTDINGSNFAFFIHRSLRLLGWTIWTYSGTSLKIWAKSFNHRPGCIQIKNWGQIICNFWSQGLTEYWHHVSHNTISLPVVILFYYPVGCCYSYMLLLNRTATLLFLTVSSHQNFDSVCAVPTWIAVFLQCPLIPIVSALKEENKSYEIMNWQSIMESSLSSRFELKY